MKMLFSLWIALALSCSLLIAGDKEDALRGGLIGAAFGALLGEIDDSVDMGTTVPVFAGLGALTGYAYDSDAYRHDPYPPRYDSYHRYRPYRRHRPYYGHYRWYHDPWYYPGLSRRYAVRPVPQVIVHQNPKTKTKSKPKTKTKPAAPPAQRHPGVSLHTVPVTLSNGMHVAIRIIKVNNHYYGPQGEPYDTLPTADTLAERYSLQSE